MIKYTHVAKYLQSHVTPSNSFVKVRYDQFADAVVEHYKTMVKEAGDEDYALRDTMWFLMLPLIHDYIDPGSSNMHDHMDDVIDSEKEEFKKALFADLKKEKKKTNMTKAELYKRIKAEGQHASMSWTRLKLMQTYNRLGMKTKSRSR
ncbi:MAG: hypothetical protein CMK92_02785 [Pseudomonas sp.]|nr:hypothetical protein [Pseudomonas sp.]